MAGRPLRRARIALNNSSAARREETRSARMRAKGNPVPRAERLYAAAWADGPEEALGEARKALHSAIGQLQFIQLSKQTEKKQRIIDWYLRDVRKALDLISNAIE